MRRNISLIVTIAAILCGRICCAQDCEKFFFTSPQIANPVSNIWVMDTDGTNRRPLFNDNYYRQALNVSRDGTLLSYSKRRNPVVNTSNGDSLWVCTSNIDGSNEVQHYLVPNYATFEVRHTSLSADKSKIVFNTFDDGFPATIRDGDLYVLDLATDIATQVTFNTDSPKFDPDFSPDSSKIIYSQLGTTWTAFPYRLERIASDGSGRAFYSPLGTGAYQACKYSPNSAKIVFTFQTVFGGNFSLHTINADGGALHSLGLSSTLNMQPTYNPGSTKLALWDAANNLRILDTNGVQLLTITNALNTRFYDINWVSLNYRPQITISPSHNDLCMGQNVVLTATGAVTYNWAPNSGLSSLGGSVVTAFPFSSTVYTITGTDANGCKGLGYDTIVVHTLPVVSVSPSVSTVCSGTSVVLTASGTITYDWSPVTGLSATTGTPVTTTPVTTTVYSVTGTDNNGCQRTVSATVNVNATPAPPTVTSPVMYCQYDVAVPLTATGAGLLWYTTATGGTGSATAITPSTATAGSTTYYVSQTTGGCESARDSIILTVRPAPVISVSPTAAAICAGSSTVLTASGGVSYQWAAAGGLNTTSGATVIAGPVATTTYTVTGTDANSCSGTATVQVTVNQLPTIVVTPNPAGICNGDSLVLTANGAVSYTWGPQGSLSAVSGPTVTARPTATTTYTVTGMDANGCVNTATITVSVGTIPNPPVVVSPVIYCQNATAVALNATGTSLLWYTSATGGPGSPGAPVPSTAVVDTVTYYVSQTVSGCESHRDSIAVIILPLPSISVSPGVAAFCAGGSATLTASGGISYTWLPSVGLNTVTGATVTASPGATTTYSVTGYGSNGCHSTVAVPVTVHPIPSINVVPSPADVCIGSSITLTATGATTYIWEPATDLNTPTGATVIATPSATLTYSVTGTDVYGCVGWTAVPVTVHPIPPPPTTVSPVTYCQNAVAVALSATGTGLLWYTSATGGTGSGTAPIPPTSAAGTQMWYVSQTVNGCESPFDSIAVVVINEPVPSFEADIKYGCLSDTISLVNTSQYATSYLWRFDDGSTDTSKETIHVYHAVSHATDHVVTLYGINTTCPGTMVSETMTLQPSPHLLLVHVTPDQVISYGSTVQLYAFGADHYRWTPDDGTLSSADISDPIATPLSDVTYTVYGLTEDGCSDSAIVHITVNFTGDEFIPSAFTPNGDGLNDIFRVGVTAGAKVVELSIYNRWGQRVFHGTDAAQGWDGTFNGIPQDAAVYEYMAVVSHPDGSLKRYKGDVTLIR